MSKEEILLAFREGKYSAEEVLELLHAEKKLLLSEGQKELWMLQSLYPEMTGFNLPLGLKISKGFDVNLFKKACENVLIQYPILLSSFREEKGHPFSVIDKKQAFSFEVTDVTNKDETHVQNLMKRRFKEPFLLDREPLIRFNVYTKSATDSYVLITVHHIIFDGSSAIMFLESLLEIYNQLVHGQTPEIKPQEDEFQKFVEWEQEMFEGEEAEEHFEFWKEQFSGELPMTAMPSDYSSEKIRSFKGETLETKIGGDLFEKLTVFSKANGINQAVLFLSAFKVFLYRYTDQEDIMLGMPTAGRPEKEFEDLIGYFIYMVSVRTQMSGEMTFSEFMKSTQYKLVDTIDHANYPTTKVLRDLSLAGNQVALRLFRVSFFYQNFTKGLKTRYNKYLPAFEVEYLNGLHQEGEQEFVLEVFEEEGYSQLNCHYDPDIYLLTSVEGILENFISFLDEVITSPDKQLKEYNCLAEDQKEKILNVWGGKKKPYEDNVLIHDLIERQAKKTPDHLAVVFGDKKLSYQTLMERSNQVADYLQNKGVKVGALVGLCCERSVEMIVGMLGILKSGAAYVPIDSEYPDERILAITSESNLKLVVTTPLTTGRFSNDIETVDLINQENEISQSPKGERIPASQEELAYVLFTSGSTGKPKGVMISHQSLVNLSWSMQDAYKITDQDAVLQFASLSFDMSVEEIFPYLISGASVVIRSKDDLESNRFLKLITDNKVTILNLPPAYGQLISQFGHHDKNSLFNSVRLVSFGGDKLENDLLKVFRKHQVTIFNAYGPTEYTVNTTLADLTNQDSVTIGKPIPNTNIYVLDKHLKPVPPLAHGELFISGAGLAKGYLNQRELSNERFIDNPFIEGTKMYRTGDAVRWNSAGEIEFIGRLDFQVKVRGFRIELEEVESVIHDFEGISGAVVIAKKAAGDTQLVAYFTTSDQQKELDTLSLGNFLTSRLPEYMVPSKLVQIDVLPLTSNGKIDRKKLANLEVSFERTTPYIVPVTENEKLVAEIWKEVLKVDQVGLEDNFFELGGHSLLATQVISRMNNELSTDLALSKLFQSPQISSLLKHIEGNTPVTYQAIPLANRNEELPLSFAQERLWFLAQMGQSTQYHIPVVMKIKGELILDAFQDSLNELISRHDTLRTTFELVEEKPIQVVQPSLNISIQKIELTNDKSQEKEELIEKFISEPFDLENGPLLKVLNLVQNQNNSYLILCMHHIISDGWSVQIIFKELAVIYQKRLNNSSQKLPDLKVQYPDYAAWQRSDKHNDELEKVICFWKTRLTGYQDLDLPTDYIRPKQLSGKGGHFSTTLPENLVKSAKKLCLDNEFSFFSYLISSVYVLLNRYSGQSDITLGYLSANRTHKDIQELIGFFVNTLILRIDTEEEEGMEIQSLLNLVNNQLIENQDYQQLPFEKLVEEIQPKRDLSRTPVFQVMVNYLNNAALNLNFGDATVESEGFEYDISKFDLSFDFNELKDGEIILTVEYASDLFARESIERMTNHLISILSSFHSQYNESFYAVDLLSENERQKLIVDWNQTDYTYDQNKGTHHLIEEQALKTPEAIAVSFKGEQISYKQLNQKSDFIASILCTKGIKAGDIVGVLVNRSIDMIPVILGIMKSGAGYLPLDPEYPEERISFMISDSGINLLLMEEALLNTFSLKIEEIIPVKKGISNEEVEFSQKDFTMDQLAYIIYTSGSTGNPKGVKINQRNLTNHILAIQKEPGFTGEDSILALATYCFDISVLEIFVPLTVGGKVHVLPRSEAKDGDKLIEQINILKPTILQATASTWQMLFAAGWKNEVQVKAISGGEPMPESLKERFMETGTEIWNMYGPTETTIYSGGNLLLKEDKITIGGPMNNVQYYVFDKIRNLCPIGVPGEIYISGDCVSPGYLNKEELTAEKFIDHPFIKGEKLYMSGDMGRWLPDGRIESLGRSDHQVKIRGFRIELGEVENVMEAFDQVLECVVLAIEIDSGKILVAYYRAVEKMESSLLRAKVGEFLPDYMIPSAFVWLEKFPLTNNGKTNRKELAKLEVELKSSHEYESANNAEQEILVTIWQDILSIEKIGINDNFFEIGGHSLLATQIISRINKKFSCKLSINQLFQHPDIASLSKLINTVDEDISHNNSFTIPKAEKAEIIPLSYSQDRLWFLDQMGKGDQFHIPYFLDITGNLDVDALEKSFAYLIERHDSLRTSFINVNGKPVQNIARDVTFKLQHHDVSRLKSSQQQEELEKAMNLCSSASFNLSEAPLLRVLLIKVGLYKYRLGICIHHIISDGWSMKILTKELSHVYQSFESNHDVLIPLLKIQYPDFAIWQKSEAASKIWEGELDYWKGQLSGYKDLILPTDFQRDQQEGLKGGSQFFYIQSKELEEIRSFTRKHRITPFALFMSSAYLLLSRYGYQKDICIGVPVANRVNEDVEAIIGFFLNTLIVRINTEDQENMKVSELISFVQKQILDSQKFQNIPVDKILEYLQPDRSSGLSPVFQVLMNYQYMSEDDYLKLGDIKMEEVDFDYDSSKFDLTFSFLEYADKLAICLEYNQDLFSAETIDRIGQQLIRITLNFIQNAELNTDFVSMLSNTERERLLVDRNDTWSEAPSNKCLHELFRERALLSPEKTAAIYEGKTISYTELNRQSDQLARYLQDNGVKADDLVGIMIDRSLEMLVALLGILKSGGAYLPIDINYPQDRISYIVEDSGVNLILTNSELSGLLKEVKSIKEINLSRYKNEIAKCGKPENVSSAGNLAYMIYTSGSTGKPKGVMIEHNSVVNHNLAVIKKYELTEKDNVLQFSTISFDIFVEEVFPALLIGATLVLLHGEKYTDPNYIKDVISKEAISVINLPTAFWNSISNEDFRNTSLRTVIIGGEKAELEVFRNWNKKNNGVSVINTYGPTEATIIALTHTIEADYTRPVPLGKPIDNVQIYILNDQLVPLSVGVPGELFIAGAGLARGYYKREDLTAEKFIDNPFIPGTKMYRTGDLVRWLNDGNIEFLGRIDDQVKIRGYRIEPGEVEQAILGIKGVDNASVIVKEINGSKTLVAFYVSEDDLSAAVLEESLKSKLPEFMIPSFIEPIIAIPLTANGKVNKRKLAGIKLSIQAEPENMVLPQGDTEIRLAEIWSELLGVEKIGADQNFFKLGGHSLLATQLISRIRERFKVTVSLANLFKASSLKSLASQIDNSSEADDGQLSNLTRLIMRPEKIPLSFAQERLWFMNQFGQGMAYHIPGICNIIGEPDVEALTEAVNYVISRHESLRTVFTMVDGTPYQLINDHVSLKIEQHDLSEYTELILKEKSDQLVDDFIERPFDLENGPLLRVLLVKTSNNKTIFGFCIHHIVSDGWSGKILSIEIPKAYSDIKNNRDPNLPAIPLQFVDYTIWQRNVMDAQRLEKDLTHWKEHLQGYETLAMPTDYSRPEILSGRGDRYAEEIPRDLLSKVRDLSTSNGSTLFGGLMTCFYAVINGYSKQKDICVGTPVANRNHSKLENLIGFFVNTVINRVQIEPGKDLISLLGTVQKELVRCQQYQETPFEKIIEAIKPTRDLSRPSIFQLMINHVLVQDVKSSFYDLEIESTNFDFKISKFDLNISFMEDNNGAVAIEIEYSTDLYQESTIKRLIKYFMKMLESFTESPGQPINLIELGDVAENQLVTQDFNEAFSDFSVTTTIHEEFMIMAELYSERIAVTDIEREITYKELNQKSNVLASHLQHAGVKVNDLVAVSMDRSVDFIIAILSVLKCGAGYVPIDPTYPKDRISYIFEDSGVSQLIINQAVAEMVSVPENCKSILIDTIDFNSEPVEQIKVDSSAVSYVIYTSGSTGQPKGVLQTHKTIVNLIKHQNLLEKDKGLAHKQTSQFASISFDVSVQEIFYSLLSGYTLNIVPEPIKLLTNEMLAFVNGKKINSLYLPTAYLEFFVAEANQQAVKLDTVERIIVAGEALRLTNEIRTFFRDQPHISLENHYGPSETHVATIDILPKSVDEWLQKPGIGRPVSNINIYILNDQMKTTPLGGAGEIYISGYGLANSYLNNIELTNQKYITLPETSERVYKTGDLGRWLPDGNIDFLGRVDDQIKIRGFRIELGEIENCLSNHTAIDSVALIVQSENNNPQMVAFYTSDEEINIMELKAHIRTKLPEYMIPSAFERLEFIPLTKNGKVDKKILKSRKLTISDNNNYQPANSDMEKLLVDIWQELLNHDKVGIQDNFFDLGGHSLLSTKLVSKVRKEAHIDLPLHILFKNPTIIELAKALEDFEPEEDTESLSEFISREDEFVI